MTATPRAGRQTADYLRLLRGGPLFDVLVGARASRMASWRRTGCGAWCLSPDARWVSLHTPGQVDRFGTEHPPKVCPTTRALRAGGVAARPYGSGGEAPHRVPAALRPGGRRPIVFCVDSGPRGADAARRCTMPTSDLVPASILNYAVRIVCEERR